MPDPELRARRSVGERLAPFDLVTLVHGTLRVPAAGPVHLQFRRFAGCPICNLHLRSFAKAHARLEQAQLTTVAFFHSSRERMLEYTSSLPFATVADPERHWYRHFGVERALWSLADPRAMWAGLRGLVTGPSDPFASDDHLGLPADFLIDATGTITAAHYGQHADDQWSVEQVVALASTAR